MEGTTIIGMAFGYGMDKQTRRMISRIMFKWQLIEAINKNRLFRSLTTKKTQQSQDKNEAA